MQNETTHTERPLKIFIAEDDIWYSELLQHHLSANPDNEIYIYMLEDPPPTGGKSNNNDCLYNCLKLIRQMP